MCVFVCVLDTDGERASEQIRADFPEAKVVQLVKPGMMVTADYRLDRVRIYVDEEGKVIKPPKVG